MAVVMKKKKQAPVSKVAVKLACSCWADCNKCVCINGKPASTPNGSFDANLCAGEYYTNKAYS